MSNFGDVFLDGVINEVLVSQRLNTDKRHIFYEICIFGQRLGLRVLGIEKAYMLRGSAFYKIAPTAQAHECMFFGASHTKRIHRPLHERRRRERRKFWLLS